LTIVKGATGRRRIVATPHDARLVDLLLDPLPLGSNNSLDKIPPQKIADAIGDSGAQETADK